MSKNYCISAQKPLKYYIFLTDYCYNKSMEKVSAMQGVRLNFLIPAKLINFAHC